MINLKIEVTIDKKLSQDWATPILQAVDRGMEEAAGKILDISKANFQNYVHPPIDTGQLLNSVKIESKFLEKDIRYHCKYAKYIEYGTAPHMPPLEPILAWVYHKRSSFNLPKRVKGGAAGLILASRTKKTKGNEQRFINVANKIRWKIFHHGTIGKPFLRPAYFIVKYRLKHILRRHIKQAIAQIRGK